jgi:hypothetical protein
MEDRLSDKKKRKFPIVLLGVAVLIIVIVVNVVVWRGYFDKQAQAASLKVDVQHVNELIAQAAEPPSELEEQLAAAQAELDALTVFPQNVDRNDVFDFILNTADECQVTIIPLVSDGDSAGGAGKSYKILQYHGTVSGSLGNVCNFMTRLHSGQYPTMIITECTIQRVSQTGAVNSINDVTVQVSLNLALYVSTARGG